MAAHALQQWSKSWEFTVVSHDKPYHNFGNATKLQKSQGKTLHPLTINSLCKIHHMLRHWIYRYITSTFAPCVWHIKKCQHSCNCMQTPL